MTCTAFCPAHITGFFTLPFEGKNYESDIRMGSKGAGFSVELGAHVEAKVGGEGWEIIVNDEKTSFLVVEKTVHNFAQGGTVKIETDLPFSQGFGMSGACALASGTAVLKELGKNPESALTAAHKAEMFCRTGMGDVLAQMNGGFEVRLKEGLPPTGKIKVEKIEKEVVLAVSGSPLATPDILKDPFMVGWINSIGEELMEEFQPDYDFDDFLDLSLRFAEETEFVKDSTKPALEAGKKAGKGSMAMIGNSVFFFGDTEELQDLLGEKVGEKNVYLTRIDNEGARVIE